MKILAETPIRSDWMLLHQAWEERETFILLPDRNGPPRAWLDARLRCLPSRMAVEHFLLFTSGTTGKPRLVVACQHRAESLVKVLDTKQRSGPVAETILALPVIYVYPFVNQWLWARCFGRRFVPTDGFSRPEGLRAALAAADQAMLCLVGAQVALFTRFFHGDQFPGVIRLHFAGGPFPQDKLPMLRTMFPNAEVFNNYGCTEAVPRLTIRAADEADDGSNVGRPLPGVELRLDQGELSFRSPYGAVGFLDEGGFSEVAAADWVPTGDLGEQCQDGSWRLNGRKSEIFKRYGQKVSLAQLLASVCEGWKGVAAFYRETDRMGEQGHVLVLSPTPDEAELRWLLRIFSTDFGRAHWPLRIESVTAMPVLANWKVDLHALPKVEGKIVHWRQGI